MTSRDIMTAGPLEVVEHIDPRFDTESFLEKNASNNPCPWMKSMFRHPSYVVSACVADSVLCAHA